MTSSSPAHLSRFYGLDTLRAVAILWVMLFHLNIQGMLPAAVERIAAVGWVGVDLFFVLSGFLIGSQLLKPYLTDSTPSLRDFYLRRAYRILPAYFATLALYFLVPAWREAKGPYALWQYVSFTWNLILAGYPRSRAFSHVWSLCVEEHFYLLLPMLLLLFMRRPNVWKTSAFIAFLMVGGIALRWQLFHHLVMASGVADDQRGYLLMRYIYYPTYTRLDGLITGVALALIRSFRPRWWAKVSSHGNLMLASGLCLIVAALRLCGNGFPDTDLPGSVLFAFPLLALGFGLLVASAVSERSLLTVRVPGAGALATLAFSLYLTHKSVAHAVHLLLPRLTAQADWQTAAIYFIACLACASVLYFAVERPFLQLRTRQLSSRTKVQVTPAQSAALMPVP